MAVQLMALVSNNLELFAHFDSYSNLSCCENEDFENMKTKRHLIYTSSNKEQ